MTITTTATRPRETPLRRKFNHPSNDAKVYKYYPGTPALPEIFTDSLASTRDGLNRLSLQHIRAPDQPVAPVLRRAGRTEEGGAPRLRIIIEHTLDGTRSDRITWRSWRFETRWTAQSTLREAGGMDDASGSFRTTVVPRQYHGRRNAARRGNGVSLRDRRMRSNRQDPPRLNALSTTDITCRTAAREGKYRDAQPSF
jgi:hypothetical protein